MKTFQKSGSFAKKPFGTRTSFGSKRGSSRDSAPAERFQATCNECHAACEVPFKPNGKKPVYCRNCYKGKEETGGYAPRAEARYSAAPTGALSADVTTLATKLDRLTAAIEAQTRAIIAASK
jgi:CxxC-x17-CxxC domain-containing protein